MGDDFNKTPHEVTPYERGGRKYETLLLLKRSLDRTNERRDTLGDEYMLNLFMIVFLFLPCAVVHGVLF